MKSLVCQLGGHLLNEWRKECSLVVMDSITVTVKVISALICQKRIVTCEYLKQIVKSIESEKGLPDPDEYIDYLKILILFVFLIQIINFYSFLPPFDEQLLEPQELHLEPMPIRETLFRGKKFIFFDSEQVNEIKDFRGTNKLTRTKSSKFL